MTSLQYFVSSNSSLFFRDTGPTSVVAFQSELNIF